MNLSGCFTLSDQDCTAIGCEPQVSYQVSIAPAGVIDIKACRNTLCGTSRFSVTGTAIEDLGISSVVPVRLGLQFVDGTSGRPTLTVHVLAKGSELKDGDVYRLTITGASAKTVLLEFTSQPVRYMHFQPNGPSCGDDCPFANLMAR